MATMSLGGAEFDALPQSVKEFAAYKSSVQNCSEKTICEYLLDLRTFFRYFLALERDIDPQSEEFNDIDISGITIEDVKPLPPNSFTDSFYTAAKRAETAGPPNRASSPPSKRISR